MKKSTGVRLAGHILAALMVIVGGCQKSNSDLNRVTKHLPGAQSTSLTQDLPIPPSGVMPFFEEIGEAVGINFTRNDDIGGLHRLMESTGGGVGIVDFDNDGWPDVFFTNGCHLPRREQHSADTNILYRNFGRDGFQSVTLPAGLSASGYWQGCTGGDFNSDGFEDLYVAAYGESALYCNQGDGTYRDVSREAGAAIVGWSTSPAFADLNGDGVLDLFVVTYVDASDDPPLLCREPASLDGYVQCSPTMFRATEDVLFLGNGYGGFINVTKTAGVAGIDGKGLGIAIFDSDGDDRPDIFVANDGTPNFFYVQRGDANTMATGGIAVPKYEDQAFEKGVAVSSNGKAQAGMGVAVADVNGDGWMDIFVTNFFGEANSMYRNQAGQSFEDASISSGLGPPSRPWLGFGAAFLDADNDGWPDLFITNGHVDDLTSFTKVPYRMPPLVFRSNHDGTFLNVSRWTGKYCQQNSLGRGLATTDLDRDGKLDLLISCQRSPSAVLQNQTSGENRSCRLRLIGTGASNRSGFHTTVRVQGISGPPVSQVIGGGSFQSSSDRTVHIGLGQSDMIPEIAIRWPDGSVEQHQALSSGEFTIVQGRLPVRLSVD